jgi:hypothetical protein
MKRLVFLLGLTALGCEKEPETVLVQPSPSPVVAAAPAVDPDRTATLPPWNLREEAVDPLPALQFTGNRLGDLPVGQSVWIEPWTIWVAATGQGEPNKFFINGYHNYSTEKRDGLIQVTREQDGWFVHLHETGFQWTAMKFPGFTGGGYDSQPVRFRR